MRERGKWGKLDADTRTLFGPIAMLEIAQLRQALLQSLENYQRCGLQRILRVSADTLPAEMLAAIEETRYPAP